MSGYPGGRLSGLLTDLYELTMAAGYVQKQFKAHATFEWERLTCDKCGWTGTLVPIDPITEPHDGRSLEPPEGECIMPKTPLRELRRPKRND